MFDPISPEPKEQRKKEQKPSRAGGYSIPELADMYTRFRGAEDELDILADLACMRRRSKAVKDLRRQLEEYIQNKIKEVQGK